MPWVTGPGDPCSSPVTRCISAPGSGRAATEHTPHRPPVRDSEELNEESNGSLNVAEEAAVLARLD